MAYEFLILEDKGYTRVVTVNRQKVHNALNKRVLLELEKVFTELDQHREIRCVVLTGAGEKSFISGADISELKNLSPVDAEYFSSLGHRVMDRIANLSIPVIAAVNGYALGGGLELALACDFVYASENVSFGLVETKLGLIPGFGGIARLSKRVGVAYAKEMIFSGGQINASEALRIGLCNRVVGEGEVLEAAKNLAEKISERGPYAVGLAKKLLGEAEHASVPTVNVLERAAFGLVFASRDHTEGINAFLEKRAASFEGA